MKNGRHVILYVEDDPDFRHSVRTALESGGYEVFEANTGEEGLRRCQETRPDLILVDLMMEEVDAGTTLVRDLKAAGCDVPSDPRRFGGGRSAASCRGRRRRSRR